LPDFKTLMTRSPKLLALASGGVAACGFAPLDLWPLTLAGLAVLVSLVGREEGGRGALATGWCWGVGHFTVGLNWIAHAFTFQYFMPAWTGYIAVVLLSLYLAVYPALAAWLVWRLRDAGGARLALAWAAAWIATEYLRATLFTGFAWNPVGATWVPTNVAGVSAWIGTYGLSGLTAGAVALAVSAPAKRAGITIGAVFALTAWALWPSAGRPLATGPEMRIVQPNVSQAQRHDRDFDEESVRRLERLTGPPSGEPRLILWPEAAVPYYLDEESWARDRLARLLGPRDLLLTGGTKLNYDETGMRLVSATNSLFAMTPDAVLLDRYDKAHLVPYGEYLPMRPLLGAIGLNQIVQSDVDFVPGPGPRTLALPGFGSVAPAICYEIVFSGQVVERASRPAFIFNPSTDAWFGAWGPPQHLAQARLRAVEEGLPVVRATPTGISAVIDAEGRLLAALPMDKPGFIATRLPAAKRPTLFSRFGNAIPLSLALLFALAAVAPALRRRYGHRT